MFETNSADPLVTSHLFIKGSLAHNLSIYEQHLIKVKYNI